MKIGTPFNPASLSSDGPIRKSVSEDRGLSPTTRIIFFYLLQLAASAGFCSVPQKFLASKLSLSIPTVKRSVKQLRLAGYIKIVSPNTSKPGISYFLWHPSFRRLYPGEAPAAVYIAGHVAAINYDNGLRNHRRTPGKPAAGRVVSSRFGM